MICLKNRFGMKSILLLLAPVLLFFVLVTPYHYVNSEFLVDWLGCGCPQMDEFGNMVEREFNANDFTAIFWLLIALAATALAIPISKILPWNAKWLRITYVLLILTISLLIARGFTQSMMWI